MSPMPRAMFKLSICISHIAKWIYSFAKLNFVKAVKVQKQNVRKKNKNWKFDLTSEYMRSYFHIIIEPFQRYLSQGLLI